MNTTTNTRGVTDAVIRRACRSLFPGLISRVLSEREVRDAFQAALSAEPAERGREDVERDAARYRLLRTRQHGRQRVEIRFWDGEQLTYGHQLTERGLDAAVDSLATPAAPAEEGDGKEGTR